MAKDFSQGAARVARAVFQPPLALHVGSSKVVVSKDKAGMWLWKVLPGWAFALQDGKPNPQTMAKSKDLRQAKPWIPRYPKCAREGTSN